MHGLTVFYFGLLSQRHMQLWFLINLNGEYQDISGYRKGTLVNSVPVKNVVEQVSKHSWLHSSQFWESLYAVNAL